MDIPEKFRKKLDELTVSGKAAQKKKSFQSPFWCSKGIDEELLMKSTDYCGLNSPGLTCYLNSVLQVLFMTEDFCEAVEGFATSAQILLIH